MKWVLCGVLSLSVLFPSGCTKASFPEEKIIQSVKDICKKEYDLTVDVKIVGETLGTYIQLDNIFSKGSIDEKALEHIGDILLSVSRVSLSTDAPIKFYVVIASDKNMPGVEAVLVRYIEDLKRFLLLNVSRADYFERLLFDVRYSPYAKSKGLVMQFFSDLTTKNSYEVLTRYVRRASNSTEFSLSFLKMLLEMKLKENIKFEILEMKIRPIASDEALVYCRAKESFTPKENYTAEDFSYKNGFEHEYLFVIKGGNFIAEINQIIPLVYNDINGKLIKKGFPDAYQQYKSVADWQENEFFLADMVFPDFIAKQIAQRIARKVAELKKDEAYKDIFSTFVVESVKGYYEKTEENEGSFKLRFKISPSDKSGTVPNVLQEIAQDVTREVLGKYHFSDFSELQLLTDTSQALKVIPKNLLR